MKIHRSLAASAVVALPFALAACGGGGSGSEDGSTLTLAHSYTEDQPQHTCGAEVIKQGVEDAGVGLTVEIFANSQLGGDADRIASVQSGDIDIDIQGASALAAVHEPVGVVDAAYAFEDAAALDNYFSNGAADDLKEDFKSAAGVSILGAWSAGARQFTANEPIQTPDDLSGLRMRFPGSPQFLLNAQALGAKATEVAYEELYLALQQGVVDGQENPIVNIEATNLVEVQDYVSMSSHQQNSNLIVASSAYDDLSGEQQTAVDDAVADAVSQMPECVEEAEAEIVDGWESEGSVEIVDDVDTDAFEEQTDAWFRDNLEGDSLAVYESIKDSQE
ncbi:DctP family TRAP transporter solute-binding subunit [Nocardioides panacisoli]|uniref:DctP family TRAP transporter solute-binding subunit n=1 Tax=Nocardioides panacisoli TaxID=627624 RepID=UPI001C6266DA|nr:DctP family TRAP transporter solute-binding subunit [Nocardioides panacisoli]QYJ03555.1 DctP family TRAP transporter solute-binding subunit [Nocardioides panacisoli]